MVDDDIIKIACIKREVFKLLVHSSQCTIPVLHQVDQYTLIGALDHIGVQHNSIRDGPNSFKQVTIADLRGNSIDTVR